jgi:hypothetical protein
VASCYNGSGNRGRVCGGGTLDAGQTDPIIDPRNISSAEPGFEKLYSIRAWPYGSAAGLHTGLPQRAERLMTRIPASVAPASLISLSLAGCIQFGPTQLDDDQLGYNHALSTAEKRQRLLNVVRLRYGDTPGFLDVTQVISRYQLQRRTLQPVTGEHFAQSYLRPPVCTRHWDISTLCSSGMSTPSKRSKRRLDSVHPQGRTPDPGPPPPDPGDLEPEALYPRTGEYGAERHIQGAVTACRTTGSPAPDYVVQGLTALPH